MVISRPTLLGVALALLLACSVRVTAASARAADIKEIQAFNQKFQEVTLHMDNAGLMALWADDGVTLLPALPPMIGKKKIAEWLGDLISKMPGYKVTKQENEFHDIRISGDWASEWGTTYQVVQPPEAKPAIESYGKILLVLHREKKGQWKIQQEMWNAGLRP